MQLKRPSCVSFQAPEDVQGHRRTDDEGSPSPARRPSRCRFRKSDGEMRSLYSVVALKDLATTLKTETVERGHPTSQRIVVLQSLKYRALGAVGTAASFVMAFTLFLLINSYMHSPDRRTCSSPACAEMAAAFEGVLNYTVDPCVDLDAFVCSKGLRVSSAERGSRTFVARQIKQYELDMLQIFVNDETTFSASRVVTDFLLECTDASDASASANSVIDFFDLMSVPWPFLRSGSVELHPLEVALTLSLKWGIDTWFRAYVHWADHKGAPALIIEASAQASTWLDFVQTLEEIGSREKYFQLLHERYNASLPAAVSIEERLATERDVLSSLNTARATEDVQRPVIARLAKIATYVRNCTLDNWLAPLTRAPAGAAAVVETTLVSVQDVRLLQAIDQILSKYSAEDLVQHVSWWLLQILIVIGSPQDYVIIAGSKEVAAKEMRVECYRMMAARFGLLLASESAVRFFTRNSRRQVEAFLRGLLDFLGGVAAKATRLSDSAKVAIDKRIQDLDVAVWPLKVDTSNDTLWKLYEHFCDSCRLSGILPSQSATNASRQRAMLLDNWLQANVQFWSLTSEQRELVQLRWQGDTLDAFRYEPLSNRLRVSHAALRRPFYLSPSEDVLPANFGGLGTAFLTHALQMFVAPAKDIEPDVPLSTWPEFGGSSDFTENANCSAESILNMWDSVALALAWGALKTAGDAASMESPRLAIRDERQLEHMHSPSQLFFLSYCRSRCAGRRRIASQLSTDCNNAVRSIGDFARTFNCTPGSPMVPRDACHVTILL